MNPTLITRLMGKEDVAPSRARHDIRFDPFLGIDYSGDGAPGAPLKGLQVYGARPGESAERWAPPPGGTRKASNWSRRAVAEMLLDRVRANERFIAGIDHCFSIPASWCQRFSLATWPEFLDDFVAHWPTHEEGVTIESLRADPDRRYLPQPPKALPDADRFRLTERWTSSTKSIFQFDVNGSVGKSSFAGMPWLKWLRDRAGDRLHVWPFDGWEPAPGKSVIAEVYPSMLRRRYPAQAGMSGDQHDACAIAMWLEDIARRGALGEYLRMPPLTDAEREIVACEGWVLGVR